MELAALSLYMSSLTCHWGLGLIIIIRKCKNICWFKGCDHRCDVRQYEMKHFPYVAQRLILGQRHDVAQGLAVDIRQLEQERKYSMRKKRKIFMWSYSANIN